MVCGLCCSRLWDLPVTGFLDASVHPTERGAAQPYHRCWAVYPTANGNTFPWLIRLPSVTHYVTLWCIHFTRPLHGRIPPSLTLSMLPLLVRQLQWWFCSPRLPLYVVRGDELNCRLGREHSSFSSLRGSWSLLTTKPDSDYSRAVMFFPFPLREDARAFSTFVDLGMTKHFGCHSQDYNCTSCRPRKASHIFGLC